MVVPHYQTSTISCHILIVVKILVNSNLRHFVYFDHWFSHFSCCFDVDFLLSIDPQCKKCVKYLACDGSYVGIESQNLHVTDVTASELNVVVHTKSYQIC